MCLCAAKSSVPARHLAHIVRVMWVGLWSCPSGPRLFGLMVCRIAANLSKTTYGWDGCGGKNMLVVPRIASQFCESTSLHSVVDDFVISIGLFHKPLLSPLYGRHSHQGAQAYASRNPSGSSLKSQPCVNGFCRNRRNVPIRAYRAFGCSFFNKST